MQKSFGCVGGRSRHGRRRDDGSLLRRCKGAFDSARSSTNCRSAARRRPRVRCARRGEHRRACPSIEPIEARQIGEPSRAPSWKVDRSQATQPASRAWCGVRISYPRGLSVLLGHVMLVSTRVQPVLRVFAPIVNLGVLSRFLCTLFVIATCFEVGLCSHVRRSSLVPGAGVDAHAPSPKINIIEKLRIIVLLLVLFLIYQK